MRTFDESARSHLPLGTREHAEKRARSFVTRATWRVAFRLWVRVRSFHDGLLLDDQRHSGDPRDLGVAFCRGRDVRLRRDGVKYRRRREATFSRAFASRREISLARHSAFLGSVSVARLTRALTPPTSGGDKPMWTIAVKTQISPWSACSWCDTKFARSRTSKIIPSWFSRHPDSVASPWRTMASTWTTFLLKRIGRRPRARSSPRPTMSPRSWRRRASESRSPSRRRSRRIPRARSLSTPRWDDDEATNSFHACFSSCAFRNTCPSCHDAAMFVPANIVGLSSRRGWCARFFVLLGRALCNRRIRVTVRSSRQLFPSTCVLRIILWCTASSWMRCSSCLAFVILRECVVWNNLQRVIYIIHYNIPD